MRPIVITVITAIICIVILLVVGPANAELQVDKAGVLTDLLSRYKVEMTPEGFDDPYFNPKACSDIESS